MTDTVLRYIETLRMIPRHPGRISSREIQEGLAARGYPVTLRTVQRDLEGKLSTLFPLVCDDRGSPVGWSWMRDAPVDTFPVIDVPTALTFSMVERYLTDWLPAGILEHLKPHFDRARAVLDNADSGARSWPDRMRVLTRHPPLVAPKVDRAVVSTLYEALFHGRRVQVRYRPRDGKPVEYPINPLGLIFRDAVTYLVATVFEYDDPRLLALHRFESCELLDEPTREVPGFDIDDMVRSGAFDYPGTGKQVRLVARFTEEAAFHLHETPLSEDQSIQPDGDGYVRIEATVADNAQLRWWLLSFADGVEVLEPTTLRTEMTDAARGMAGVYGV